MALWRPYADSADEPLDLSVERATEQSFSPISSYIDLRPSPCMNTVQHSSDQHPVMGCVHKMCVPVAEVPSECSGYIPQNIHPPVRTVMMSSPGTPLSMNGRNRPSYLDADALSDDPEFKEFERHTLRTMAENNGGTFIGNNPRMRRAVQSSQNRDDSYRKQRERNNIAAKQSRDRRRLRELHMSIKVTYLNRELARLKALLASRKCTSCHRTDLC